MAVDPLWIEQQMRFLTIRLGLYRPYEGASFIFDPTPGFYGFIAQGTPEALNDGMRTLADHIAARTTPRILPWTGQVDTLTKTDHDFTVDKQPPGLIRYQDPYHSRVELNPTHRHSPYVMGAILAHELTHHFLFSRDIFLSDVNENERLTDLAAVYLGLGKVILNGYDPISWTIKHADRSIVYTEQIGYLQPDDIAQIYAAVATFRHISPASLETNLTAQSVRRLRSTQVRLSPPKRPWWEALLGRLGALFHTRK